MPQAAAKIRALVVDDHALFRESVARALSGEPDFEPVLHCGSIQEALHILGRQAIDIVLLDYDLGYERGSQFLPAAEQMGFPGRVLVVTAWVSDAEALRLIRQGASGIFLKENPLPMLAESIRQVSNGGAWLDQRYLKLLAGADPVGGENRTQSFSDRERKILRLIIAGLANKEIAAEMQLSESSVKAILQRLFQKTGVRTRGQLVRVALEQHQHVL